MNEKPQREKPKGFIKHLIVCQEYVDLQKRVLAEQTQELSDLKQRLNLSTVSERYPNGSESSDAKQKKMSNQGGLQVNDAFISYSRSDERIAAIIQRRIENINSKLLQRPDGIRLIRDEPDIGASPNLEESLKRNIQNCRYLLLVLTPKTFESDWVIKELDFATRQLNPAKPLLIAYSGSEWQILKSSLMKHVAIDVEPLGVRIGSKYWVEKLSAGLANVEVDTLINRSRRRRFKKYTQIVASTLVFTSLVLWFSSTRVIDESVITTADPTPVLGLQLTNQTLRVSYDQANSTFESETCFEIGGQSFSKRCGITRPMLQNAQVAYSFGKGRNPQYVAIRGRIASIFSNQGDPVNNTRTLPANVGVHKSRMLVSGTLNLLNPFTIDENGLPDGFVDENGIAHIYDGVSWSRVEVGNGSIATALSHSNNGRSWWLCVGGRVYLAVAGGKHTLITDVQLGPLESIQIHPNGWVAYTSQAGPQGLAGSEIWVLNLADPKNIWQLQDPLEQFPETGGVHTRGNFFGRLKFSPNGEWIAALSISNRVSVWNTRTGKLRLHITDPSPGAPLTAIAIDNELRYVFVADFQGKVIGYRRPYLVAGIRLLDAELTWGASKDNFNVHR